MEQTHDENSESDTAREGRDRTAEELRLLLDAIASRAEEHLRGLSRADGASESSSTAKQQRCAPEGSATCGWCPLCSLISLMRSEGSQLGVRLPEQLAGLVVVLRQALADHSGWARAGAADDDPNGTEEAAEDTTKAQPITVHRVRGSVLRDRAAETAEERDC